MTPDLGTPVTASPDTEAAGGSDPFENPAQRRAATQAVAASFFILFCIVGVALWGLPFFYDFMVQQFGWTRAQVTSGNAVGKLIIGPAFGFIAGWVVDHVGPKRVLIFGILVAAAALIGLGSISTLPLFYLFYSLNALGYVCGGPLPCQVLLSRWFVKSRGKAIGFAYLGIGFGGAAVPWIAHLLVRQFGWQMALRGLGVLILLIALPFALFIKEAPGASIARSGDSSADVKKAFKTLSFALLTFGSMFSVAAVSGTQQNMKLFLSLDRHYAQREAAQVFSFILAFSIVGRVWMGWLADRWPKKYVMLLIYTLVAVGIPFMFLGRSPVTTTIAAAVFGIGLGGDYMIIPLITAEIFGLKILGRLMGVLLTAAGVAEALSPWLIGHLRDATGSYFAGCIVLATMALLGAVSVLGLPSQRRAA